MWHDGVLGREGREPIEADQLDTVPWEHEGADATVEFTTDELKLGYVPRRKLLESKSLKLYPWGFRDRGVFAEDLAATLLGDLAGACDPVSMEVDLTQRVRGGLRIRGECGAPKTLSEFVCLAEEAGWDGIFPEDYLVYHNDVRRDVPCAPRYSDVIPDLPPFSRKAATLVAGSRWRGPPASPTDHSTPLHRRRWCPPPVPRRGPSPLRGALRGFPGSRRSRRAR